jgi:hypothetical protein
MRPVPPVTENGAAHIFARMRLSYVSIHGARLESCSCPVATLGGAELVLSGIEHAFR